MNSESRKLMSVSVIPAQPGTYVLEDDFSGDRLTLESFVQIPILAWRIMTYREDDLVYDKAAPVCHGIIADHNEPIMHPDGRVDVGAGDYFESLADYLEYRQARRIPAYPFVCGEC